ncbi:MAG TPA: serine/threonine-protein kinase, partial [Kofleriaceae bacterium]|nr:serine/threonine-protein kinase [Kofleriaceae bacterium]
MLTTVPMSPLARAAAAPAWTPPEELHEYKLVQPLGAGGMGQVFLAHDRLLDRLVAVKFIAGELDRHTRERFIVEARAAARLQHPNVVTVYRVGEVDHRPYLVSEFVRGETLDVVAKPMPSARILELAIGLARGLSAAHRRGVLHRDIKPANAIVAETGDVKLLDFGLAKLDPGALGSPPVTADRQPVPSLDMLMTLPIDSSIPPDRPPTLRVLATASDGSLTQAGTILGTPSYMSPEAWRGEVMTRRSDIYSLGALLYELAAGSPPHRASTIGELQQAVAGIDAAPIASIAVGIEPTLAAVIDRCLRRDPAARFGSGEELVDALDGVGDDSSIAGIPDGNPYRGLAAFEAEHRASFFGRGSEIRVLVDRLRSDSFVLVAGESGVGKSSLCRAGVLPAVAAGALGERALELVTLVPGHRPIASVAAALASLDVGSETELVARLVAGDAAGVVREIRARLGKTRGILVFVDQLEEIVTLARPDDARIFAELLAELALPTPGVRVIATVRGDFLTRLAEIRPLDAEIARALYVLRPLDVEGIRAAVVGPARTRGVAIDDALVDALVEATSASSSSAGLPLLQFALAELWEARDRGVIRFDALERIGGVTGALAR